ncbi:MAG: LysR substrate-binding domain-containing protein [Beijerinckiaceae bacterium]
MDLRQIRCFIAVAEEMHFGRAAERLHMAPTALSRLVRGLEDEIGVRLLNRTTRAVTLTRAGLGFLEDAKAILDRTEDAARNAREIADGRGLTLRIGAIDAASASFLPAAINMLRRAHPNVDLRLTETMTAPQLQMLRTGRLDLALIRPPTTESEFPFEVLREERLVAVLPEEHPLAEQGSLTVRDLASLPVLIPARRARPYAYDLVMAYFASAGLVPRILQETTEKPAMLAMVASGMGVALVPDWVETFSRPGIVFQRLDDVSISPTPAGAVIGMAWRDQQRHAIRDSFLGMLRAAAQGFDPSSGVDSPIKRIAAVNKSR